MEDDLNELIREYGSILLSVLCCLLISTVIGYACACIIKYNMFFAEFLMGN